MKLAEDWRRSVLQAAIEGKLTGGGREGWRFVRLGEIGNFVRGHGIKKSETTETGKPCIRYGQLYTTYKTSFSEAVSFVPDAIFQKSVKVHKNDILMALTGKNKIDIALAVAYMGDDEIAVGGDMTKFTYTADTINPMYLVYCLNSPYAISRKSQLATGNIIVHISNDKLASIIIPLPPIDEQRRIVSRLDEILPLIAELESAENELEALERRFPGDMRGSLLQAAIEGRLTGSNTDNWRWVRLKEVGITSTGTTPSTEHREYYNGDIPFIGPADLNFFRNNEL